VANESITLVLDLADLEIDVISPQRQGGLGLETLDNAHGGTEMAGSCCAVSCGFFCSCCCDVCCCSG
jgi:hypothetical protein